MDEISSCKEPRTYCALRIRALYFEPNPSTATNWREGVSDFRVYSCPIDRRVAFVCESPGGQVRDYDRVEPRRCWAVTAQNREFYAMRQKYRFESCYVTNSVKCGVQAGRWHTEKEMEACSGFLARELDLVAPLVAVGLGNNALYGLRRVAHGMEDPPVLFQITHYSARRGKAEREWPHEMAEL
ncbi:uracil-DNA glycosylase family protein [Elusimicrobiota bacterium]